MILLTGKKEIVEKPSLCHCERFRHVVSGERGNLIKTTRLLRRYAPRPLRDPVRDNDILRPFSTASNRGFTLLELIIVIVILGITASLVAPRFGDFFSGYQLDASARRLLAIVRYALTRSSIEGLRYRLECDTEENKYQLTCELDPFSEPGCFKKLGKAWGREVKLPETVLFDEIIIGSEIHQGDTVPIIFYPGRLEDNIIIKLENQDGENREIFIRGLIGIAKILPK